MKKNIMIMALAMSTAVSVNAQTIYDAANIAN